MHRWLQSRALKLMSVWVLSSEFFILFLKGSRVPIWGASIIQPSVIRLLDEVAHLVPHGPHAWHKCLPFGDVVQDPKVLMHLQHWTVLCVQRWYHLPITGATGFLIILRGGDDGMFRGLFPSFFSFSNWTGESKGNHLSSLLPCSGAFISY